MVKKLGIQNDSTLPEDSSLQSFFEKVDEIQSRITSLFSREKGGETSLDALSRQLFEELNLLMEELHVAAEELHAQNRELVITRDELEKERQRYQDLFHFAPDGYLVTDHHGMILEANQAAGDLLEISPHYLLHKPLAQFIPNDRRRNFRHQLFQLRQLTDTPEVRIDNWEFTIQTLPGKLIDVAASVTAIQQNEYDKDSNRLFRWLIRDMRAQKRFEKEMRELKNELLKSRERGRQQLARGLHDGPVQDLHGVIFQLKPLENNIDHPRLKNNLDSIETQLIDIVRKLRLICTDLRPPTLIPFGLEKAIRSHAGTFLETHPEIDLVLDLEPDEPHMAEEIRLVFFQIYQQALANVFRHAETKRVWVRLLTEDARLVMEIEDNGKGFEVPNSWIELVRHHHYGLADAAERAESIGGKLVVDSRPGQGTKVRVLLPIDQAGVLGESIGEAE